MTFDLARMSQKVKADCLDLAVEVLDAAKAEIIRLTARVAELEGALGFYADKSGWNQPPVKTRDGLISVEYENQASKIQRDRGSIAHAALSTPTEEPKT